MTGEPVRGAVEMETEAEAMPLLALEMEEGANAEECRDSRSWRQDEEMILP